MNKLVIGLAIILSIGFSQTVKAQEQGISVIGKAEVAATPDRFTLSFTLTKRHFSFAKAKAIVDEQANNLVAKAKKLGINSEQIKSLQFTVNTIYDKKWLEMTEFELPVAEQQLDRLHIKTKNGIKTKPTVGFEVNRQVVIQLNSLTHYDKLLQLASELGVAYISPVTTQVSNGYQLYQQALKQAIANATAKAKLMAKQANITLGKVIWIRESGYQAPMPMRAKAYMAQESFAANHQSQAGTQTINATVELRFAIK